MSAGQGSTTRSATPLRVTSAPVSSSGAAMAPELAIFARGIKMMFRSGSESYWVLEGIDLDVPVGTLQFLMGPSGVGKTTLLSILAGILTPTEGTIVLLGQALQQLSRSTAARFRLKHIGFIFQELNLLRALTALENVELSFHVRGMNPAVAHRQALALLEQVSLADKAHQLPRNLSGGEKQRVAIARAIAGYPDLVFADEPTSALDSHNGDIVLNLLRQLTQEHQCTVLMATHDHRFMHYADRIWQLENGRLQ